MRRIYYYTLMLFLFFFPVGNSVAQYCVPQTYYGCYSGYMQYTAFSTSGGTVNINFSPGGYPNPIVGSNSYPGTCCNVSNEGYAYIPNQLCVATPGSTISFSLHTSNNYPMYYKIWVDYNINGSFSDPGETVYSPSTYQSANQTLTGSFTVPTTATPGLARLRLAATYYFYGGSPSPCQTYSSSGEYYGTFSDFDFVISGPCGGVPNALSISTAPIASPTCPGQAATITAVETNYSTGLITKWMQGPTATGPFTVMPGVNSLNLTTSAADSTFYVAIDSCTNSSAVSSPSNAYLLPVQSFSLPYTQSFTATSNNTVSSCFVYNDNNGTNFIKQSGLHSPDGTPIATGIYANDPVSNAAFGKKDFFTIPGLNLSTTSVYAINFSYARGKSDPFGNTGNAYSEHLQLYVNNYQPQYVVSNVTNGTLLFDQTINFNNVADTTIYFTPVTNGGYYFTWYTNTPHPGGSNSSIPGGVVIVDSISVSTSNCIAPSITAQPTAVSACVGSVAAFTVAATGTGDNYQWQKNNMNIPGATNNNFTITSTSLSDSGSYSVIITNPCGSATSSSVQLSVHSLPSASVSPSSAVTICSASGYTLSASTNASNPSYLWKLNGNNLNATGGTYMPVVTGLYTVSITDNNNCTNTSGAVNINVNPSPPATITPNGPTSFCTGDSVILFGPAGAGLSWQWYNGTTLISGATSSFFTASTSGNYIIKVQNANCTLSSPAQSVVVNTPPVATISVPGPTTICQGSSIILSGTPGLGYTYTWNLNGSPTAVSTQSDTVTAQGNYTVTVAIGACATTSGITSVSLIASPTASVTPSGAVNVCLGGSITLTANTGSGYSYQWQLNGIANGNTTTTQNANATGTYDVIVTDSATGCSAMSSIASVNIVVPPNAVITPGTTAICSGNNMTLNANTGSGYTYQWQNNGVDIPGATGASYTASPVANTNYSVVITDAVNCQNTSSPDTIIVNIPPLASIVAGGNTSFCPGGSVALQANAGANLQYQWQLNNVNIPGGTLGTYIANSAGYYTVTVTDIITGCFATSSQETVVVNPNPAAQISANGPTSFCPGSNVVLSGLPTPPGYSYTWLNGSAVVGSGNSYTANAAGNFRVVVTNNATTCFDTSSVVAVSFFTTPSNTISPSGPTTFCVGSSVVLNTTVIAGVSYQWQLNGININLATASSYTASAAGTYTVVLSNGSCSNTTAPVTITTNPLPPAIVTPSGPTTLCSNENITLAANTGIGLSYQWQIGGNDIVGAGATASSYITDSTGNYTVEVTDVNGCSAISSPPVTVNVNPVPHVTITTSQSPVSCEGDSVHLFANTGGVTGLVYQWQNNGANVPYGFMSSYFSTVAGIYDVIVKSANGCQDTSAGFSVTINPRPLPVVTAVGSLLSTGTYSTYQWYLNNSAIANAQSSTYSATQTGSYRVFVTDNNFCSGLSDPYEVTTLAVGAVAANTGNIRLYPNPATYLLHIDAPAKVKVIISNLEGQALINESNVMDIDISKLAIGIYSARIYDNEGILLKVDKLVKSGY